MGPQTLNDFGLNVIVLVLGMYSCPDAADRNCLRPGIDEIAIRQSPGRRVPNRSNTGSSKWRSWRVSFVAEVTNEDHATQDRCDRIFLHQ